MNMPLFPEIVPEGVDRCGLEIMGDDEQWHRLDVPSLGGKWWDLKRVGGRVRDVARHFHAGHYRPWYAHHSDLRKKQVGPEFDIRPEDVIRPDGAPPPQPPAPPDAQGAQPSASAAEPAASAAEPQQPMQPVRTVGPPRARMAMPAAPMLSPGVLVDPNHPLTMLAYLDAMNDQKWARAHEAHVMALQMQADYERQRHDAELERERLRGEQALAATRDFQRAMAEAVNRQPAEAPGMGELRSILAQQGQILQAQTTALAQVRERLDDEDSEDEDDERETVSNLLARLSDNPTDAERIIVGLQNTLTAALQSPVGQAIAARIQQSQGAPGAQPPPQWVQPTAPPPVEAERYPTAELEHDYDEPG